VPQLDCGVFLSANLYKAVVFDEEVVMLVIELYAAIFWQS
jgi:hypothetical protein